MPSFLQLSSFVLYSEKSDELFNDLASGMQHFFILMLLWRVIQCVQLHTLVIQDKR